MAVDESLYRATESLILPSPRKFYRVTLHAHHWQLRSLISAPYGDYVYFPSATEPAIYRLNIHNCRRELVATIKFLPRCLSAAPGWICCGGENGQFTVIRLVEDGPDVIDGSVAADSRLPLDLDPSRRATEAPNPKERSFVRTRKIGGEIVNCVTFWFPPPKPSVGLYKSPVVVLANNDHTVTIVDLQTSDELQTIKFEDCINRAVISPDGRLLIAIGDDPYLYVFCKEKQKRDPFIPSHKPKYAWAEAAKIQLTGQYHTDTEVTRGSFAASFSRSGAYLAVGTQYGIISVFDATNLTDPESDPLITVFTTSRPNSRRGAVRDLEFSPDPHDLLVWTENNGRIGIADSRDNFMSRQIISVDPRAEGMSRVGLLDRDDIALVPDPVDARYLTPESRALMAELEAGRSDSPDLLSENIANARLRNEITSDMLERLVPQGESASGALQVLQALQEQRRARDAMREAEGITRDGNNITTTSASWTMSGARVPSTIALNRYSQLLADRNTASSNTLPSILREFTSSERTNASLRAYISERNQERERRGQQPRRRGSVILDAASRALDREFRDLRAARTSQIEASSQETLTRLPPRLPAIQSTTSDSPSNPWAELETLYGIAVDPPVDIVPIRVEIEGSRHSHSEFASTGEQSTGMSSMMSRQTLEQRANTRTPEHNPAYRRAAFQRDPFVRTSVSSELDETCGCTWSRDGRILFVATEEGILEYHVNTAGRKFFPSLTLR